MDSTTLAELYRLHSAAIVARLIRICGGDFGLAEEAVQDAFSAALEQWSETGMPEHPRAWLARRADHVQPVRRQTLGRDGEGANSTTRNPARARTRAIDLRMVPPRRIRKGQEGEVWTNYESGLYLSPDGCTVNPSRLKWIVSGGDYGE